MRSREMLLELKKLVVRAREADRRQRVLSALRTLVEARGDLARAGYALVPLEPTEAMLRAAWGSLPGAADVVIAAAYRAMVAASAEQDDPA